MAKILEPTPVTGPRPKIVCRRIGEEDIGAAITLLSRGFPERSSAYWRRGLSRLRDRTVPEPHPRFGYVLTDGARLVGIVLLIFSQSGARVMTNVSSWYVEPAYRGYSNVLLAFVFRLKGIVLFNVSPGPGTIETIGAQGFVRYNEGTFHALPAIGPIVRDATIREFAPDSGAEATTLGRLASYGCRCYEVVHAGRVHAFAFLPTRFVRGRFPCAQLVYCSDIGAFVRFAGPIGRRLLRHGLASVMVDANGPIEGLRGRYIAGRRRKYFRGDAPPHLSDLSETELVIFGP